MHQDEQLLNQMHPDDDPLLHFYDWRWPSCTYGYFLKPEELLSKEILENGLLDLARRPTGGGMVFHLWDLTFSLLVPRNSPDYSENALDNYHFAHDRVLNAIYAFLKEGEIVEEAGSKQEMLGLVPLESKNPPGLNRALPLRAIPGHATPGQVAPGERAGQFCFAKPTQYDVLLQGKKVAGAAQRNKKQGFLHQGSISLIAPDYSFLERALLSPSISQKMRQESTFISAGITSDSLESAKQKMRNHLQKSFEEL